MRPRSPEEAADWQSDSEMYKTGYVPRRAHLRLQGLVMQLQKDFFGAAFQNDESANEDCDVKIQDLLHMARMASRIADLATAIVINLHDEGMAIDVFQAREVDSEMPGYGLVKS